MNVVPAKVAGVEKIIMTTPCGKDGKVYPSTLVAAMEAGADEIYKVGGAQAIAALAFGTESIPKVDKIVGPGNIYVALAKKAVYGHVSIDSIAGPSEILVLADETANPHYVAADLLSQAEHDRRAAVFLITPDADFGKKVEEAMTRQTKERNRKDIIESSIGDYAKAFLCQTPEECFDIVNKIAPEHLEIELPDPEKYLPLVVNAGAIFLGKWTSEPLGDYMAGPNHTLPTSGTAAFSSPLGVYDFMKHSSVEIYNKEAFHAVAPKVMKLALAEGLDAHAAAVEVRYNEQ